MASKRVLITLLTVWVITSCSNQNPGTPTISPLDESTLQTPLPEQHESPTVPPIVLSTSEAHELVRELLENNAGCQLPCWWGINPGETTWEKAHRILEKVSSYVGGQTQGEEFYANVNVYLPYPSDFAPYMEHLYRVKSGVVEYIRIYNYNLAPNYYLPKFLETYGRPSEIWMQPFSQEEIGQQNFAFILFYADKGILVKYGIVTPIVDVAIKEKLQVCLEGADSPFLFLWSPEKNKMSFQDAKQKFIDTTYLPEPQPLLEATGMDVNTFYETFKNPDTNVCLETPKDLWP